MVSSRLLSGVVCFAVLADYLIFALLVETIAGKRLFAFLHLLLIFAGIFASTQIAVVRYFVKRLHVDRKTERIASALLWVGIFLPGSVTLAFTRFVAHRPREFLVLYSAVCFGFTVLIDFCVLVAAAISHFARRFGLLPFVPRFAGAAASTHFLASPAGRSYVRSRRIEAAITAAAARALLLLALRSAAADPVVLELDVPVHNLPLSLSGFRIVQVTDLHAGATAEPSRFARVVRMVNALQPDAVVLIGDIVDGEFVKYRDMVLPLADLRAPHGVYYVTGMRRTSMKASVSLFLFLYLFFCCGT